ncbi:hypothetical protein LWI28_010602 [Acer negundo]|uniref:Uncharacterized protein n=1 Tax=Acer negundo TaxID=4023 RepID=A0AAD5IQM4_ACENE|nr:hypothetical protein LWI28_010602 [Acer negundo]
MSTQDDDFDIPHADGLELAERQRALEKGQADITSWQINLESLIHGLTKTVITGFTELREELRLTSYVRRPRRATGPTTVPNATFTIGIPHIPATVAEPNSSNAPVSTPDRTLLIARPANEETAQIKLVVVCSLTDRGVRSTGGPRVDEAAAHRRLAKAQARRGLERQDERTRKGRALLSLHRMRRIRISTTILFLLSFMHHAFGLGHFAMFEHTLLVEIVLYMSSEELGDELFRRFTFRRCDRPCRDPKKFGFPNMK